jgi:predicted site-specific integrase-resolvase|tara:strand:- start:8522 stop:8779 length:258 start_codon:yes stop_codon:yes gene_type:complete
MSSPFVSAADLAAHFDVHEVTIREWRDKGYIPRQSYIRAGQTYRYNLDEVIKHMTGQSDDAESEAVVVGGVEASTAEPSVDEDFV